MLKYSVPFFLGICLSLTVSASELNYVGHTLVSDAELHQAFGYESLDPSKISPEHVAIIRQLYQKKNIDFIGVVDEPKDLWFRIVELPYWDLPHELAFLPVRMNSVKELLTPTVKRYLNETARCLTVTRQGPENYRLRVYPASDQLQSGIYFCSPS